MLHARFRLMAAIGCLAALLLSLYGCDNGGSNAVSNVRVFNAVSGSQNIGGVNARLRQVTATPVTPAFVSYGSVSPNQQRAVGDAQDTFLVFGNNPLTIVSAQKFDYKQDNLPVNSTGELLVAKGVVGQTAGDATPSFIYVRTSVPLDIIRQNGGPTANSLLRVVNAAPNSGDITVYNEQGTAPITDLSGIGFGNYSSGGNTHSNFATLTAANYNLTVRDSSRNVLVNLPNVTFQAGNAYTLIVYGSPTPALNAPLTATFIQDYPLQ